MGTGERVGVLLANTGTPSAPTPQAVRSYLAEFLSNPRIVPMNRALWSIILHAFILPRRARASAAKYASIWTDEGSPLLVAHKRLEADLARSYADSDLAVAVCCGMSFGEPSLGQALSQLREAGCSRIVCLPLYPQSAYATTSVVRDSLDAACHHLGWDVPYELIDHYGDNRSYVRAVAASIRQEGFDAGAEADDRLVFSLHSIPLADVEAGDTYELQVSESCRAIAEELGLDRSRWTISYQSRFDKSRNWLSPSTKEALIRIVESGASRVFVACPGFATECLETLVDIDRDLRQHYFAMLDETGVSKEEGLFCYVPCLGGTKAHVAVLRDVLAPYVEGALR